MAAHRNAHDSASSKTVKLESVAPFGPLLGSQVDRAPNPEAVHDLVIGNYLARYLVHETEIYVLRIWHHREDRF
jgi:hypothetical protein